MNELIERGTCNHRDGYGPTWSAGTCLLCGAEKPVASPPPGTRLVLMGEDLFKELGASRVEWGEPDENGWYTPTLYKDYPA